MIIPKDSTTRILINSYIPTNAKNLIVKITNIAKAGFLALIYIPIIAIKQVPKVCKDLEQELKEDFYSGIERVHEDLEKQSSKFWIRYNNIEKMINAFDKYISQAILLFKVKYVSFSSLKVLSLPLRWAQDTIKESKDMLEVHAF